MRKRENSFRLSALYDVQNFIEKSIAARHRQRDESMEFSTLDELVQIFFGVCPETI